MAEETMDDLSWKPKFGDAFQEARKRGLQTFDWKGKRYSTNLNDPLGQPVAPTVPSARPPSLQSIPSPVAPPTPQLPPTNLNDPMGGTTVPRPTTVPMRPGEIVAPTPAPAPVNPMTMGDASSIMRDGRMEVGPVHRVPQPIEISPQQQYPALMEAAVSNVPQSPGIDLMSQQIQSGAGPVPPQAAPVTQQIQGQAAMTPPQAPAPASAEQPFDAASQQLDPSYAPGPPTTPEEKTYRMEGWKQFLQKIASDPGLQMMALKMGTQMMQPIPLGGNVASHLGSSLQSGVDYGLAYNEIQRKAGLEREAADTQGQLTDQQMIESKQRVSSSVTDQAGKIQQQQELQSTWPQRKAKFEQDLTNAKSEAEVINLKRQVEQWQLDNKDKIFDLELKTANARLRAEEARVKAYEAAMRKSEGKDKTGEAAILGARAFVGATDAQVREAWVQDVKAREQKVMDPKDVPMGLAREKFFFMNPGMAKEYLKHAGIAGMSEEVAAATAAIDAAEAQKFSDPNSDEAMAARSAASGLEYIKDADGKWVARGSNAPGAPKYTPPPELDVEQQKRGIAP